MLWKEKSINNYNNNINKCEFSAMIYVLNKDTYGTRKSDIR